jgi:disulfide bond formation protein DsbB
VGTRHPRTACGSRPWLVFAIAAVATVGSLWLSGGAGFTPCTLCWYQRIAMYPLALILGIAAWRRDVAVRVYVIPLAAIGALVSCYHIVVERFPDLESSSCDPNNPCSLKWVEHLGFVTIPTMALAGFLAIITVLALLPAPAPRSEP